MTFEQGITRSLNLLAFMVHEIVIADMDTFFSSLFSSGEYQKTDSDLDNLDQLKKVQGYRTEVEKIQQTLTSEHPGANSFSVSYEKFRAIRSNIQFRSNAVTEIEDVVDTVRTMSDYDESARISIIGAYRSCRESYITVDFMINTYNEHNLDHPLPRLRIPKEVNFPS
jgi:hypothetical protein